VAVTAKTAEQLSKLGYDVVVESGAGQFAAQTDDAFVAAGADVADAATVWSSDVVVKVNAPDDAEIGRLQRGATVVSLMAPARSPELVDKLAGAGVTALAMDAVPRISRAQSMDVLSSMANVAGYRAVVEAAHEFGRMFTGQVTAAGKTAPARVFVVGAGVAGLAAIGAASAMGAVVRAFDVRPEVAEQVESMGAQFVRVEMDQEVSSDGYAKEMTAEQEAATAAMYAEEARTAETIAAMAGGSVIVDMAAANGGNSALTVTDQRVVTDNGVVILGYTDLAGRLAAQTSQLYGTNIVNLFKLLTPGKDGQIVLDFDDVIQRGITVAHDGAAMWPPPPVQVSAAPAAAPVEAVTPKPEKAPLDPRVKLYAVLAGAVGFGALSMFMGEQLLTQLTVLMLSVFVGYYVISNVAHALHTPLMAETNAISGIILVGGILQVGSDNLLVTALSVVAILVASINIFGGFMVTSRMLEMFRKD
jgi:NAD(P) transhydrogenase subunit alpha